MSSYFDFECSCSFNTSNLNLTEEEFQEYDPYFPYFINIRFKNYELLDEDNFNFYTGNLCLILKKDVNRNLPFSGEYKIHYGKSSVNYLTIRDPRFGNILCGMEELFREIISDKDIFETVIQDAFVMKQADIEWTQKELENKFLELAHYEKYL